VFELVLVVADVAVPDPAKLANSSSPFAATSVAVPVNVNVVAEVGTNCSLAWPVKAPT
jgi:hypothetical protein